MSFWKGRWIKWLGSYTSNRGIRHRIQRCHVVFGNCAYCPYFCIIRAARLEFWGQCILCLQDLFHTIPHIQKCSGYFLLEVTTRLSYSNQSSSCFYPKSANSLFSVCPFLWLVLLVFQVTAMFPICQSNIYPIYPSSSSLLATVFQTHQDLQSPRPDLKRSVQLSTHSWGSDLKFHQF